MNESGIITNLPWATVVLSAGNSTRMKAHKALLGFDSGHTFIQKIVNEYKHAGCNHIIIVANKSNIKLLSQQFEGWEGVQLSFILNEHLNYERFYSIKLGIAACDKFATCFIQPIDNPFITTDLLKKMLHLSAEGCYIVPAYKGKKGHPVLLGNRIMKDICETTENNANFKEFLRKYKCIELDTDDKNILENMNDLNDYQQFFENNDKSI